MDEDAISYSLERAAHGIGLRIVIVDGWITLSVGALNDLVKEAEENGAYDATVDF